MTLVTSLIKAGVQRESELRRIRNRRKALTRNVLSLKNDPRQSRAEKRTLHRRALLSVTNLSSKISGGRELRGEVVSYNSLRSPFDAFPFRVAACGEEGGKG